VAVPEHTEEPLVHLGIAMRRQQLLRNSKSLHSERWSISEEGRYRDSGSAQDGGDKGRGAGRHAFDHNALLKHGR
jgi:hypothetical protein